MGDAGSINAQVSNALVRSCTADNGPRVLLLKYSRRAPQMRQLLLEAEELAPYRSALYSQELAVELQSGAMIFVHPDHHAPALAAVRLYGWTLHADHVLVDPESEPIVEQLVQQLRGCL